MRKRTLRRITPALYSLVVFAAVAMGVNGFIEMMSGEFLSGILIIMSQAFWGGVTGVLVAAACLLKISGSLSRRAWREELALTGIEAGPYLWRQLRPHILFPAAALGIHTMIFCAGWLADQLNRLGDWETWSVLVMMVTLCAHPLVLALLSVGWFARRQFARPLDRLQALLLGILLVVGTVGLPTLGLWLVLKLGGEVFGRQVIFVAPLVFVAALVAFTWLAIGAWRRAAAAYFDFD